VRLRLGVRETQGDSGGCGQWASNTEEIFDVRGDTTIVGLDNRCTGDDCDGTRRGGLWTGGAGITGALKPDEYAVMDGPT